jgi:hypothetical protein
MLQVMADMIDQQPSFSMNGRETSLRIRESKRDGDGEGEEREKERQKERQTDLQSTMHMYPHTYTYTHVHTHTLSNAVGLADGSFVHILALGQREDSRKTVPV